MRRVTRTTALIVTAAIAGGLWTFFDRTPFQNSLSSSDFRRSPSNSTSKDISSQRAPPETATIIEDGSNSHSEDSRVSKSRAIRCHVRSCDGQFIAGCAISIELLDANGSSLLETGETGADGGLVLNILLDQVGSIWVTAAKEGWTSTFFQLLDQVPETGCDVELEIHPARLISVDVTQVTGMPIEGALISSMVWRETDEGLLRYDEGYGIKHRRLARTDSSGRASIMTCASETATITARALGYAPLRSHVEPGANTGVKMLEMKLDAFLFLLFEDPVFGDGATTPSLCALGVQLTDSTLKMAGITSSEKATIDSVVRQRMRNDRVRTRVFVESNPAAYPPELVYTYKILATHEILNGNATLRRLDDLRSEQIIRPSLVIDANAIGSVLVTFPSAATQNELPRDYWGLVGDGEERLWCRSSELGREKQADYSAGRKAYKFDVPVGAYSVACESAGNDGVQFSPARVIVRSRSESAVAIETYHPIKHCGVMVVCKTEDGRLIEGANIGVDHVTGRRSDGRYSCDRSFILRGLSATRRIEVPVGEYMISVSKDDHEAEPEVLLLDSENQVLTCILRKRE